LGFGGSGFRVAGFSTFGAAWVGGTGSDQGAITGLGAGRGLLSGGAFGGPAGFVTGALGGALLAGAGGFGFASGFALNLCPSGDFSGIPSAARIHLMNLLNVVLPRLIVWHAVRDPDHPHAYFLVARLEIFSLIDIASTATGPLFQCADFTFGSRRNRQTF
jgi:hypothetical protein